MGGKYLLFVRHEVYLQLASLRGKQRNLLLSFLDSLAHDPFQSGDYAVVSPEGRPIQVKITERFAVLFWADHAASEIKVIDLVAADG